MVTTLKNQGVLNYCKWLVTCVIDRPPLEQQYLEARREEEEERKQSGGARGVGKGWRRQELQDRKENPDLDC